MGRIATLDFVLMLIFNFHSFYNIFEPDLLYGKAIDKKNNHPI